MMKLPSKKRIFNEQQLNSASNGERIMMSDITVVKSDIDFMTHLPHIQLRSSDNSLNNVRKQIMHNNRLSPYLC